MRATRTLAALNELHREHDGPVDVSVVLSGGARSHVLAQAEADLRFWQGQVAFYERCVAGQERAGVTNLNTLIDLHQARGRVAAIEEDDGIQEAAE
jgi:hypothetical protein